MLSAREWIMLSRLNRPLFWCWLFVLIWAGHVVGALIARSWPGAIIAFVALFGTMLVLFAVLSRRRRQRFYQEQRRPA
jgi:putative effector of murein hydrolase LrgA (UPF0299 family)